MLLASESHMFQQVNHICPNSNDDGEKDSSPNFHEKALDKIDFSCIVAI